MNVLLLVIDSLRACALDEGNSERPQTPFLDRLGTDSLWFRRAYATECWTLPTHASIFTGLLPSEHAAHFQTMAYSGARPTIAERFAASGYHTEVVTRNFIFDGTIPGITRGFQHNTRPLAQTRRIDPFALFLALAKPRFRRHVRETGFFHPLQRDNRRFLRTFARALIPADVRVLDYALHRMTQWRNAARPYFLFCNLYDVHAPYPPSPRSILRSFWSLSGCAENLMFPKVMARLGRHRYLQPDFRVSDRGRRMLLGRYHRAIELMDAKLAQFFAAARASRLFENTLVILASDHGEAFGEHGLYLHDASVWNTHLHVPLWILHPQRAPTVINDVVSTRDLFGVMHAAAQGSETPTMLDRDYRMRHPVALAEHFSYPHLVHATPRYRQNLAAAIAEGEKIILRDGRAERYDLSRDPAERAPADFSLTELGRHRGSEHAAAFDHAAAYLQRWCDTQRVRREGEALAEPLDGTRDRFASGSAGASPSQFGR